MRSSNKTASPRLKRPTVERTGPIRNSWGTTPPGAAASTGVPPPLGMLENSVRTAYAVIDDYLRRGQAAAFGMFNDPNRREYMNDEKWNNGGYNPMNPFSTLTEQWMIAMRAWSQAWSAAMPGMWQAPWNPAPYGMQAPQVTVQVASSRPSEVRASLAPALDLSALTCDPLCLDGGTASIDAPVITAEPGGVLLCVKVGDQPAGQYRGCIRKRMDGSAAGEVTVKLT